MVERQQTAWPTAAAGRGSATGQRAPAAAAEDAQPMPSGCRTGACSTFAAPMGVWDGEVSYIYGATTE